MRKCINLPSPTRATSRNTLLRVGITGLLLAGGATTASGDEKNYATQLELKNCGAYQIYKVQLERKQQGSSWDKVKTYDFYNDYGQYLYTNQAFCLDLSKVSSNNEPVFVDGDQARFRVYIDGGSKVNCDGTNYGKNDDGKSRRLMKMKGTTYNNNGCRSVGYKSTLDSDSCPGGGVILKTQSC